MNYWAAHAANLEETVQPLLTFLHELSESGAVTAKEYYGVEGWVAHGFSDIWMGTQPFDQMQWSMNPVCGVSDTHVRFYVFGIIYSYSLIGMVVACYVGALALPPEYHLSREGRVPSAEQGCTVLSGIHGRS